MKIGYAISKTGGDSRRQRTALKKAGCEKIFLDDEGGSANRFREAIEACQAGDVLIVDRFYSLGGNLGRIVDTIGALAEKQIGFASLKEGVDTSREGGDAVLRAFASLAVSRRENASERTKSGVASAREGGTSVGRPSALSGAKLEKAKALMDEPGASVAKIAKKLKVSRSTLYRYLKSQ